MNEDKKPAPMSAEKRTALLRYMAVLFAVAFLIVLLSYLIQAFSSRNTINQLSSTSASALQNAERLQETNRELTGENRLLNDELDNAQACILEYQESVNTARQTALAEGRQAAVEELGAAYDLLLTAMTAKTPEEKQAALAELAPMKGLLTEQAMKEYTALLSADETKE